MGKYKGLFQYNRDGLHLFISQQLAPNNFIYMPIKYK